MSGRPRGGYAGQYAISEVDFWLNDPRIQLAGSSVKVFYHYAWMIAVKERREVLPAHWTPRAIGKAAGLDTKTTPKAYQWLLENSLLGQNADGRVIVTGVKNKHRNLKWKDDPISAEMGPQMEREMEGEMEMESESRALATSSPEFSDSDSNQGNGRYSQELRRVTFLWDRWFPKQKLSVGQYGKIWAECKRHAVSPEHFIMQLPKDHLAPWELACGYFADKWPWPDPNGSDCRGGTFIDWQKSLADNSSGD